MLYRWTETLKSIVLHVSFFAENLWSGWPAELDAIEYIMFTSFDGLFHAWPLEESGSVRPNLYGGVRVGLFFSLHYLASLGMPIKVIRNAI